MSDFTLDFRDTGPDGTTTYINGADMVVVTVSTPTNDSKSFSQNGSTLRSASVDEPTSAIITFDTPVSGVTFELYDVDSGGFWDDQITIIALDAYGNEVPVTFSDLAFHHTVSGNTIDADGNVSPGVDGSGAGDTVTVTIPGSIVSLQIIHDNGDSASHSGVVQIGPIDFDIGDVVVPCFTLGTMILTPTGEKPVEELRVGDGVITRDNGVQNIVWIGTKSLEVQMLRDSPHLRPVKIHAGSLGAGLPDRDLILSPNHRLLISNEVTSLYFEEQEVLAAAKHLINNKSVHMLGAMDVTYIHFMFDNHEIVLANGSWTESFQPGDYSLKGIGSAQRNEIFELFPDLKSPDGIGSYLAARKVLKKHEASLILPA